MFGRVLLKRRNIAGRIRTLAAFEGLFAGVRSRVQLEVDFLRERLLTELTLERPFARVDSSVAQQPRGVDKVFLTVLANSFTEVGGQHASGQSLLVAV